MTQQTNKQVLHSIRQHFNDDDAVKLQSIQSLWSDYGEIARYWLPSLSSSVVVKSVNPPDDTQHPRGWNTTVSHQRKLDSYRNEQYFYQHYSAFTDNYCHVPRCLGTGQFGKQSWLILQDLDQHGFTYRCDDAPLALVKLGLRWLAYFHARFLQEPLSGLWPIGTYWHLATRPDEWQKMPDGRLKQQAQSIDNQLNQAGFQTLLHGDAKLANFCFSQDQTDLAAVDFQYVGAGVGVKDVAYFLGSCFDSDGLIHHADMLLDHYFSCLHQAAKHYVINTDIAAVEHQWRALYPLAWADFQRFLIGWATEHYKINDYMLMMTDKVLTSLNN
ncbi:phosphotransferase [Aliiglaciecola sp. LCG003]|uniref:phosphotransferase n=1 Tax=Aliiglaciecola sp. LCG003 TaxID=3053655 RepID=UPI00257382DD|nr:phosphotransferase [Aliiglaciecola sp. LCG003]WJG08575.1 phosphotransferase [Aliiglaciecola sp. LCG003]